MPNNWFNLGRSTYDSVMFVPPTHGSSLAKLLQKHEEENNQGRSSRIRIVERAGSSLKSILAPNDPWGVSKCSDAECFPCGTNDGPSKVGCRVPGVMHQIICTLFESDGNRALYIGETGRNAYSRGKKHVEDFLAGRSSHCMVIHHRVHHPDVPKSVDHYRMEPVKSFRTPLDRQVSEALTINNSQVDVLMNSGSEWRVGRLPRAAVSQP